MQKPRGDARFLPYIDGAPFQEFAEVPVGPRSEEPCQDISAADGDDESPSHLMKRIERKYYRQWEHNLKDKMRSYSKGRR